MNANLNLESNDIKKKRKAPRRILHFSDGNLEEYSTDEDESYNKVVADSAVKKTSNQLLTTDLKNMYWSSWFWYHIILAGTSSLAICDYLGEKLAAFFGITSPKYEYEIDYYKSMQVEEEERSKQEDLEMGGWINDNHENKVFSSTTSSNIRTDSPNKIEVMPKERF